MRKLLIILCCIFTLSLVSCGKPNPTGTWYFNEATTTIGETVETIKIGDEILEFRTTDFIFKDETGEIKVTYYYGEGADSLKAGDKFIYSGLFVKSNNEIVCLGGMLTESEEVPEYYTIHKIGDIQRYLNENYIEGQTYNYTLFGEIKQIVRPFSGPKYEKEFMTLTLESDGTGVMKSFVPDFTGGLTEDQNLEYNLTWVQVNDVIKITVMGETQLARMENGCLILEEKGNQYDVEYASTTLFTRS